MRICSFIFVLLAISVLACGQSNFVKAIVINNNGDSIHGNIDYRNWKNNPKTINFINAANEKQAFDASSVRGFYIPSANETYKSFTVELDMLPGDQSEAISNKVIDSPTVKKRVFLLQLVTHPALGLYLFTTQQKDHFYYARGNEGPVELIHHYVYDEPSKQVRENTKYREQLSDLLASCPDLVAKSRTIKFRRNEIQNIILKYLQCTSPGSVVETKKKDPVLFKFGIVAGVMSNQFNFVGTEPFLADDNYSSSVSPLLGLSLDIGLSRNRHKWHIVNELIYKIYKTDNRFTQDYGTGYTVTSDIDLSFSYFQLNTLLRYVFLSNTFLTPYINFGIANGVIIVENKNSSYRTYSFGGQENLKAIDGPRKYEISVLGGAGLAIRKIHLEARYAGSTKGFSPYHALDVRTTSFQFIFTYQF